MRSFTIVGGVAVAVLLLGHAFERRSHWATLVIAAGCATTALYAFVSEVWPLGVLQFVWYLDAMRRWVERVDTTAGAP